MQLDINGQYKSVVKEQAKLKKMIEKNDQRLALLKIYIEHVKAVARSREEIKKGKLIPQEKLFRELGF